jgi:hypothetical protein
VWDTVQIFGDPEAADIVFTCGADILVVGINITHQVYWTGALNSVLYSLHLWTFLIPFLFYLGQYFLWS